MAGPDQPAPVLEGLEGDNEALFSSDNFRMQCMKVLPCSKRFVHDWTECPFAHPQEKARRRDPRVHNYTGIACPSMKKEGCCAFGDHCPYAHNVFEYWLHPTRYRTQLCNDGSNCKRKICFFSHSLDELRVPACKPFVSPEALASAAAAAAADAEAKRKAATIGSPLSSFASLSPGPSPQRSSFEALRAAQQQAADARMSGMSPHSPSTADEAAVGQLAGSPATRLGSSPSADAAVHAALQQLSGAGFTSQEQQVIELVTSLLAQDKVSPEQAASILQQMLPSGTLNQLQAHLNTPRSSTDQLHETGRYSDPLSQRFDSSGSLPSIRSGSFGEQQHAAAAAAAAQLQAQQQQVQQAQQAQQALTLEHMAAMQAAQSMGLGYSAGMATAGHEGAHPRASMDSLRSSFDTGAGSAAAVSRSSSSGSESIPQPQPDDNSGSSSSAAGTPEPPQQLQPQQIRPSVEAALRRMSAEEAVGSASQQHAALHAAAAQQRKHHHAVQSLLLQRHQQLQHQQERDRFAAEAALHQRRQLLQLQQQAQQQMLQQQAAAAGARPSEDSTRMSFETGGRGSIESMSMLGTPRGSLDASYPPTLLPTLSGSYPGQAEMPAPATPSAAATLRSRSLSLGTRPARYYSAQLSSVPEQFPMINAPLPTSASWGAGGRFSLDSAADRLSEDMGRLSFEASARAAPQPTANPYASSFFSPGASAAMPAAGGMADRRALSLPPLPPPVRTSAPANNPGLEEEESSTVAAAVAAQHQQLLGGTAMHRLQ